MKQYVDVAKCVRLEIDESNGETYIVFKIIDEQFKQKIRQNWLEDIELKVINKTLVEER